MYLKYLTKACPLLVLGFCLVSEKSCDQLSPTAFSHVSLGYSVVVEILLIFSDEPVESPRTVGSDPQSSGCHSNNAVCCSTLANDLPSFSVSHSVVAWLKW